jgi:L-fuconolactonase
MRIDSHQHFWRYRVADFPWIDERMAVLRHDYLPWHLEPEIRRAGIEGVVAVQARQSIAETEWLLQLAAQHAFIKGVVGWVPLAAPNAADELDRLHAGGKLKAVRHVIQDEPEADFILRDDFNAGIRALRPRSLAYDILIFARHLPQTIQFVDRHPGQVFILDHLAKPRIAAGEIDSWATHLRELARRPNVYAKVSGLVTEADWKTWRAVDLRRYFDVALAAFGPSRLMFGSDWPVCIVACGYAPWHAVVRGWIAQLSPAEQARVLGGTAIEAYRLS